MDRHTVVELRDTARAASEAGRDEAAASALAEAFRVSCEVLVVTDPLRLAVAGAYGDAHFARGDVDQAFEIARTAYEDAVFGIEDAAEHRREAVRELGELRDRLTFWAFRMETS